MGAGSSICGDDSSSDSNVSSFTLEPLSSPHIQSWWFNRRSRARTVQIQPHESINQSINQSGSSETSKLIDKSTNQPNNQSTIQFVKKGSISRHGFVSIHSERQSINQSINQRHSINRGKHKQDLRSSAIINAALASMNHREHDSILRSINHSHNRNDSFIPSINQSINNSPQIEPINSILRSINHSLIRADSLPMSAIRTPRMDAENEPLIQDQSINQSNDQSIDQLSEEDESINRQAELRDRSKSFLAPLQIRNAHPFSVNDTDQSISAPVTGKYSPGAVFAGFQFTPNNQSINQSINHESPRSTTLTSHADMARTPIGNKTINQYELCSGSLGAGKFGTVIKVRDVRDNNIYAMKIISKQSVARSRGLSKSRTPLAANHTWADHNNQSINQSMQNNQSINHQPINHQSNTHPSADHSTDPSIIQSTDHSIHPSISQLTNQPINQSSNQPMQCNTPYNNPTEQAWQAIRREVAIMMSLDHPNIVRLIEVIDDARADALYLVMELAAGGPIVKDMQINQSMLQSSENYPPNNQTTNDSAKYSANQSMNESINQSTDPPRQMINHSLSLPMIRTYFRQIFTGLAYLDSVGIVHRDIKPSNLLLSHLAGHSECIVKIADFGMSHSINQSINQQLQLGTPGVRTRQLSQSINQSIQTIDSSHRPHAFSFRQASNQPTNQSTNQPINKSSTQPITQTFHPSTNQSTNQSINQSINQSESLLSPHDRPSNTGSAAFLSPEQCGLIDSLCKLNQCIHHTVSSDIWSTGISLYLCTFSFLPFYSTSPHDLYRLIVNQSINWPIWRTEMLMQGSISEWEDLHSLIDGLLQKRPCQRLSFQQISEHPFLTQRGKLTNLNYNQSINQSINQKIERSFTVLDRGHQKHSSISIRGT